LHDFSCCTAAQVACGGDVLRRVKMV
jgi:hypothetical protein